MIMCGGLAIGREINVATGRTPRAPNSTSSVAGSHVILARHMNRAARVFWFCQRENIARGLVDKMVLSIAVADDPTHDIMHIAANMMLCLIIWPVILLLMLLRLFMILLLRDTTAGGDNNCANHRCCCC